MVIVAGAPNEFDCRRGRSPFSIYLWAPIFRHDALVELCTMVMFVVPTVVGTVGTGPKRMLCIRWDNNGELGYENFPAVRLA